MILIEKSKENMDDNETKYNSRDLVVSSEEVNISGEMVNTRQ